MTNKKRIIVIIVSVLLLGTQMLTLCSCGVRDIIENIFEFIERPDL